MGKEYTVMVTVMVPTVLNGSGRRGLAQLSFISLELA